MNNYHIRKRSTIEIIIIIIILGIKQYAKDKLDIIGNRKIKHTH